LRYRSCSLIERSTFFAGNEHATHARGTHEHAYHERRRYRQARQHAQQCTKRPGMHTQLASHVTLGPKYSEKESPSMRAMSGPGTHVNSGLSSSAGKPYISGKRNWRILLEYACRERSVRDAVSACVRAEVRMIVHQCVSIRGACTYVRCKGFFSLLLLDIYNIWQFMKLANTGPADEGTGGGEMRQQARHQATL
jgi:hypothetical protein